VVESSWREGLFRRYEKLVRLQICGISVEVPENNTILRCVQFCWPEALSSGRYCWNGECTSCQVRIEGEAGSARTTLACRVDVSPGMVITGLSPELISDLGIGEP
jgi:NADH dehydrogenase/NADH:ubiquinone oxidoreductase subunit G